MEDRRKIVCFGSSKAAEGGPTWTLAEGVGRLLAARDLTVISGGYAGVMGAVSRGARAGGGHVVGVTTTSFPDRTVNADVHEERVESDYATRMAAMLNAGDGFIAFPGGLGTLSEWLTAWTLATIGQLGGPLWIFESPWKLLAEATSELEEVADGHPRHLSWVRGLDDFEQSLDRWLRG